MLLFFMIGMASVTEQEIFEVTKQLGPDELKYLYYNLEIPQRDIDNEEKAADTTDPRLKAIRGAALVEAKQRRRSYV